MIIFKNTSAKIISINSVAVMPDASTELPDSFAELPSVKAMVEIGKASVEAVRKPQKAAKAAPAIDTPKAVETQEEPVEATTEAPVEKPKRRGSKKKVETTEEEERAVEEELAHKIFG